MKDLHVKRGAYWIAISLLLGATGCGGDSGTNGGDDPVATTSVTIGDNFFNPASNAVSSGATVTWTWAGNIGHNVTFASSAVSAPSPTQPTGTFQVTMPTAAGEYAYQCTIHPTQMNGTVTVQ